MIDYNTFKENIQNHKKLWEYISLMDVKYLYNKDMRKIKYEVIEKLGLPDAGVRLCYLCEIANYYKIPKYNDYCNECPVKLENNQCLNGLYYLEMFYLKVHDYDNFKLTAQEIAHIKLDNEMYKDYVARLYEEGILHE